MTLGGPRGGPPEDLALDPTVYRPWPDDLPGRLTRAELLGDLRGSWRTVVILVVAGLPLGALWVLLAPPVRLVVLPDGSTGSLSGDSDHAFDAVAVFVLLTVAFGVVAGALAWRRRRRRGPVLLVTTVLGALAGAWTAGRVGDLLASTGASVPVAVDPSRASGGTVDGPDLAAALTTLAPSPGPWWIALAAGLAAALTFVFAAIVNGHEDMDRPDP